MPHLYKTDFSITKNPKPIYPCHIYPQTNATVPHLLQNNLGFTTIQDKNDMNILVSNKYGIGVGCEI